MPTFTLYISVISSNAEKYRPEKYPNSDTFDAALVTLEYFILTNLCHNIVVLLLLHF